jgi:hypothetical protein
LLFTPALITRKNGQLPKSLPKHKMTKTLVDIFGKLTLGQGDILGFGHLSNFKMKLAMLSWCIKLRILLMANIARTREY